jgi:hypothetical protein
VAEADVVNHRALPDSVLVTQNPDLRMTPNQIRALKAESGQNLSDLMDANADEADRMQAIVWLALRRQGYEASWDDAADVAIEFQGEPVPDPTNDER